MTVFRRGPAAIVAGDVRDQLRRVRAETKRRLGLRLTRADLADVRAALHGIDASRKYVLGYGPIYAHLKARLSQEAAARLGDEPIYPVTPDLIALAKSFGPTSFRESWPSSTRSRETSGGRTGAT